MRPRRNVVVLCLDAVRADTFAARATRLADLADVTVTGCRAASGWGVPSHASMFTGLLAHEHRAYDRSSGYEALDPADTLPGEFDGHTMAACATPDTDPVPGFDALFDEFHEVRRTRPVQQGFDVFETAHEVEGGVGRYLHVLREALSHDSPGASVSNAVRVRLDQLTRKGVFDHEPVILDDGARTIVRLFGRRVPDAERDAPVFAFADFTEACAPMLDRRGLARGAVPRGWSSDDAGMTPDSVTRDPEAYVEELAFYRHLYAENVAYLDRLCAELAADLLRATERETTVVVTAAHGENLLDDPDEPEFGHVGSLSEAVLHVPLVLINPPAGYPPIVDGPVSHLDFRSLVRGLAAGETPDLTDRTVAAELIDSAPEDEAPVTSDSERGNRVRRCFYPHAESKLRWDDRGDRVEYTLSPDAPCTQERVSTGTGGVPGWTEAVFGESAAETYARIRRGTTDRSDPATPDESAHTDPRSPSRSDDRSPRR